MALCGMQSLIKICSGIQKLLGGIHIQTHTLTDMQTHREQAYFLHFEKIKVSLWDHLADCIYIPPINFWMSEHIFMKFGLYIMTLDPILTA
jgi:hypothetical protein